MRTSLLCTAFSIIYGAAAAQEKEYAGMMKFLSAVSVYDESKVAPGHWFIAPYEINGYREPGGSWIGPHIYDSTGGLIWSGSHLFHRINVMDFGIMNVNGEDLLSMSYAVEGEGYILDHQYNVKQTVFEGVTGMTYNMHDFHTVEDGSRFLYLQRNITHASAALTREDLGYDGECSVTFPGFEERDATTGDVVFKWDATGIIPLSDSTLVDEPVAKRCTGGNWDYLHSNAIDKLPDGNYLLSTRHSDTIYKISKDDGSIMWRLHGHGGQKSDFSMGNLNFSRQHDVRFRGHNGTHIIISFLDNATGADPQPATTPWSRGLLVALQESDMTASMIAHYDHPHHGQSYRRGNYQVLPNGNIFMGWSEQALHSEHTADGEVVMEAVLTEHKLGTYRSFKFPFVSDPQYPPDIYANASSSQNKTTTSVYASWNGATEIASWALHKTDEDGLRSAQLVHVPKSGFETTMIHEGFARYVVAEAMDIHGNSLGKTPVTKTLVSADIDPVALAEELSWLSGNHQSGDTQIQDLDSLFRDTGFFLGGAVCAMALLLAGIYLKRKGLRRHPKGPAYERVDPSETAEFDETRLDDLGPP